MLDVRALAPERAQVPEQVLEQVLEHVDFELQY